MRESKRQAKYRVLFAELREIKDHLLPAAKLEVFRLQERIKVIPDEMKAIKPFPCLDCSGLGTAVNPKAKPPKKVRCPKCRGTGSR